MDKKFLEGFAEITAAYGLSPSQAHELLVKEAANPKGLINAITSLFGRKAAPAAATAASAASKPMTFGRVVSKPFRVTGNLMASAGKNLATKPGLIGAGLATAGIGGYHLYDKAKTNANQAWGDFNQASRDWMGAGDAVAPATIPAASGPTYTRWGTPMGPTPTDPFNPAPPTTPATGPVAGQLPRDPAAYAQTATALRNARAQAAKVTREIEAAKSKAQAAKSRIDNPGVGDYIASQVEDIPIIGGIAKKYQNLPVQELQKQIELLNTRTPEQERALQLQRDLQAELATK